MEKNYLIINIGSTSKKYAFYKQNKIVYSAHFEIEKGNYLCTTSFNERKNTDILTKNQFENAIPHVLHLLTLNDLIKERKEIFAIGIRIVAPGTYFLKNRRIDTPYIKKLKEVFLHINPTLEEIFKLKKMFTKIIGVSDSVFHKDMPNSAKKYAIPETVAAKFEIYKYGYHGISLSSIQTKLRLLLEKFPKKVIMCHLGGGASITAIHEGISVDTSMGFSPLEGIYGGTRVGDIDAAAVIHLGKKLKLNDEKLKSYLNLNCGLIALGKSGDMRILLEGYTKNNKEAKEAVEMFIYKIKKYIGAYTAIMNGVDLLVFSGAIGENSSIIRSLVCTEMQSLGISLDGLKNTRNLPDSFIENTSSQVKIFVAVTNEMEEIAKEINKVL